MPIKSFGSRAYPQGWYGYLIVLLSLSANAEYIPTVIDGETVIEFGDYGKAPNQYPTSTGELNVISSTHVFRAGGVVHIVEPRRIIAPKKEGSGKRD